MSVHIGGEAGLRGWRHISLFVRNERIFFKFYLCKSGGSGRLCASREFSSRVSVAS